MCEIFMIYEQEHISILLGTPCPFFPPAWSADNKDSYELWTLKREAFLGLFLSFIHRTHTKAFMQFNEGLLQAVSTDFHQRSVGSVYSQVL